MTRKKDLLSGVLIVFVLLLVGVAALYALWPQLQPHATLHLGDGVFTARVVKSEADLQKGLSGTSKLSSDKAMIFVFGQDDKWSMWMKGMNYPLDIVWLNHDKQVVYIVKNAPPDSYPEEFTPKTDARYVIELSAGTVDGKSIHTGATAVFDENNLEGINL